MKRVIQLLAFCMLFCLSACQEKKETLFIEKDGKLYEVFDQVSFYYPETFSADARVFDAETVQFCKNEEIMSYSSYPDSTDNTTEEMAELYEGQLQQMGAGDIVYHKRTLPSGNECYVYTGKYTGTGIEFKHVVYFAKDATYIYRYQAPHDLYKEHIGVISKYLESLTIHYE